jgi:hypothetical protein
MVLLTAAVMQERRTNEALDTSQEMVIRRCVYNETPKIGADFGDSQTRLLIPKALSDLYRQHPSAVLELLLKIVDGANPDDSVLAAGYAVSLLNNAAVGVVCVDVFDKDTYDKVDKAWKTTPRKHWMRVIEEDAREQKRR